MTRDRKDQRAWAEGESVMETLGRKRLERC